MLEWFEHSINDNEKVFTGFKCINIKCDINWDFPVLIKNFGLEKVEKDFKKFYFNIFKNEKSKPDFYPNNIPGFDVSNDLLGTVLELNYQMEFFKNRSQDKRCDLHTKEYNELTKIRAIVDQSFNEKELDCMECRNNSFMFSMPEDASKYDVFNFFIQDNKHFYSIKEAEDTVSAFKNPLSQLLEDCKELFDMYMNSGQTSIKIHPNDFIARCPKFFNDDENKCFGYINKEGDCNFKSCKEKVCIKCIQSISEQNHVCDPNVLSTKKMYEELEQNSNTQEKVTKCPTCYTYCQKKSGCNTMWCILCKTGFDWETKKVLDLEKLHLHNPDYSSYLTSKKNLNLRENGDQVCGGIPRFISTEIMSLIKLQIGVPEHELIKVYFENSAHNCTEELPALRALVRTHQTSVFYKRHFYALNHSQIIDDKTLFEYLWIYEYYKFYLQEMLSYLETFCDIAINFFNLLNRKFENDGLDKKMSFKEKFTFHFNMFKEIVSEINVNLNKIYIKRLTPCKNNNVLCGQLNYFLMKFQKWQEYTFKDFRFRIKSESRILPENEQITNILPYFTTKNKKYEEIARYDKNHFQYWLLPEFNRISIEGLREILEINKQRKNRPLSSFEEWENLVYDKIAKSYYLPEDKAFPKPILSEKKLRARIDYKQKQ